MVKYAFLTVSAAVLLLFGAASPALAAQPYPINFHAFDLSAGSTSGVTFSGGALTLAASGLGSLDYTDPYAGTDVEGKYVDGTGTYDSGTWTSPVYSLRFPFNELVSSWNATTPIGTWVQSEVRPQLEDGHWGKWYILGRWSSSDADFHRTSVGGQGDADGYVSIDTFFTKDHPAVAYQLRLTLFRRVGSGETPTVTRFSAVASNLTNQKGSFPSTPVSTTPVDLQLPQYSQEIHHGEYPEYDNGGEAWCSPTSTSMVVGYWGTPYAPTTAETSWVNSAFADPWVDFTARAVFDYHYDGAGNWPFNAAYAASRGLVADVTQLHDLREAEPFIRAGVPLVASVAWNSNKLTGAIKNTNGHLLVIGGFTADGNVVAYDPASVDDTAVRHVYDRAEFERAWIPASGGVVYVIRPASVNVETLLTANNS